MTPHYLKVTQAGTRKLKKRSLLTNSLHSPVRPDDRLVFKKHLQL